MSLLNSIEKGIDSATYNPEAEKAREEAKKQASEAKQKYRTALFTLRDKKAKMIQEKKASDFFIQQAEQLANDGFAWLTANPDADASQITDQSNLTAEKYQDISKANIVLLGLSVLPPYYKTNASDLFLKKQITEEKQKEIGAFADSIEAWLKTSKDLSSEAIFSKQQEFQQKAKQVLDKTGIITPAVTNEGTVQTVQSQVQTKETQVKKEEEADRNTFKLSRLLSETGRIALNVVGSLFIVMLILVSGMLTANDAIGRDPQYRIFYFIYGGLGFPVMLLYYLYRWFRGTAPHIYRLLPLYNQQSDTTLGRFLLFPFTYVEDQAAKDAKTEYMTDAAKLVGKEYKAITETVANAVQTVAESTSSKMGSILTGIQDMVLNTKKETNSIVKGLEKMELK
jgi:hypothetical protein